MSGFGFEVGVLKVRDHAVILGKGKSRLRGAIGCRFLALVQTDSPDYSHDDSRTVAVNGDETGVRRLEDFICMAKKFGT